MKRVISDLLAPGLLMLASLAPVRAAEVSSVVNVCNVGNTPLFVVAITGAPHATFAVDGWRRVSVGDCGPVTLSSHNVLGFAVVNANGQKGMQVYDASLAPDPAFIATETSYCIDPRNNFHRQGRSLKECTFCQPGEVLARFAFHVKPKADGTLTLRIPADRNGKIFPLIDMAALPPFALNAWMPAPDAGFQIAMRGLAEQQERLGFRIEQHDAAPTSSWPARYVRELGIVVRPETHAVSVAKGSPADKARIRGGDEIVRIDTIELKSAWQARSLLARTRPGERHAIVVLHGGQLQQREITLDALPASLAATDLHPEQGWLGIEFESSARVAGVIYREGSAHLELDDRIQKIGRTDFDGVDGLAEWLAGDKETPIAELQVWRRSSGKILVMTLDKLD